MTARARRLAAAVCLLGPPLAAQEAPRPLAGSLPAAARVEIEQAAAFVSLPLPVAPAVAGAVQTRRAEGALNRTVWQVPGFAGTVDRLAQPLREALIADGATILLDCTARVCGGFAFRYATDTMPGPEMHVDLGDYRFIAARTDDGTGAIWTTAMVSRTPTTGFVQITRVEPVPAPDPPGAAPRDDPEGSGATALAAALDRAGHAVLDGLAFETGASALGPGPFAMLDALGEVMRVRPALRVVLVGHTDAEGALDANIALSRRRAEAVRDRLISEQGIDAARIRAEGAGYLAPVARNDTAEGRAANRRVEVIRDPGD